MKSTDSFLNKIGSDRASAQLKFALAIAFTFIASALLISGIYAEADMPLVPGPGPIKGGDSGMPDLTTMNDIPGPIILASFTITPVSPASNANVSTSISTINVSTNGNTNCTYTITNSSGNQTAPAALPTDNDSTHQVTSVDVSTLADGPYNITVFCMNASDATDNDTINIAFNKDAAAPTVGTTFFTPSTKFYAGTPNYVGFADITATVSDTGGSGLDTTTCEYTRDGSTWNAASWNGTHCYYTIGTGTNGAPYVHNIRVKDRSGNQGTGTSTSANLDTTAPVAYKYLVNNNSWFKSSVNLSFNATDFSFVSNASGTKNCDLYWDYPNHNGTLLFNSTMNAPADNTNVWFNFTGLTTEGNYIWDIACYDNVAWSSWADSGAHGAFRIDNKAPNTTASVDGGYTWWTWTNQVINVTLTCNDGAGSGCNTTIYCIDTLGEGWASCTKHVYSGPFPVNVEGSSNIYYISNDSVGNTEAINISKGEIVEYDGTPPVISWNTPGNNSYLTGNITLNITAIESYPSASLPSGFQTTCGGTLVGPYHYFDGNTYHNFYAYWNASNASDGPCRLNVTVADGINSAFNDTIFVNIDNTAPSTTATPVIANGSAYSWGAWTASPYVNVTITCDDSTGAGCANITYCLDTANSCTPNTIYTGGNITISTTGTSYIRHRANDTLGNTGNPTSGQIMINTPPTNLTAPAIAPATAYTYDDLTCNITITDGEQSSLTVNWTWFKNGAAIVSGETASVANNTNTLITTLGNGNTTKADQWICGVMPCDGLVCGMPYNSTPLTIQNAVPTAPTIGAITPSPAYKTSTLTTTISSNSTDADGDAITYWYQWSNDSGFVYIIAEGANTTPDTMTLNCSSYSGCKKGATMYVQIKGITSDANSSVSNVQSRAITNTIPTAPTTLALNSVYVGNTLTATCSGSADVDSDAITYYYEFKNINSDTVVQAWSTDNTYVIQVSDAHDTINVTCGAYDGTAYSAANITNGTTVLNTAPTTPTTLTPTTGNYGGTSTPMSIVCSGSTDADGDSVTYTIDAYYDSAWTNLEANGDGAYNWTVSGVTSQSGVDLRCNASDLSGSTAYYNPAGTLTVDNTVPGTSFITPQGSPRIYGDFMFNISAWDTLVGVNTTTVQIQVGTGGSWQTMTLYQGNAASGNYTATVDTTGISNGWQDFTIRAYDLVGNENSTEFVTVYVDNSAPGFISITPADGTYNNTGSIDIAFTANDTGAYDLGEDMNCSVTVTNDTPIFEWVSATPETPVYLTYNGLSEGVRTFNITCYDNAASNVLMGMGNSASGQNDYIVDSLPVVINSLTTTPDMFACNLSGHTANSIVHVVANVTDIGASGIDYVDANIASLGLNIALINTGGDIWEGDFDVPDTSAYAFSNGTVNITIEAYDLAGNSQTGFDTTSILLYSMQTPPMENPTCEISTDDTTNMCDETDFNNINFIHGIKSNGSMACHPGMQNDLPWGNNFTEVVKFNFASVNFSSPDIGEKMSRLGQALQPKISGPYSFEDSYIYVNVTAFTELNTSTTITFYGLPFGTVPEIVASGDTGGVTIDNFVINNPYYQSDTYNCSDVCFDDCDTNYCAGLNGTAYTVCMANCTAQCETECAAGPECNGTSPAGENCLFEMYIPNSDLTFTVDHFSQYNITDEEVPIITINAPPSYITTNTTELSVTLNGTGTQLSRIIMLVDGNTVFDTDGFGVFSNCVNETIDWDVVTCNRTINVTTGTHTLFVSANDYAMPNPGNNANATFNFTVDNTGPTVTLFAPANNSWANTSTLDFTFKPIDDIATNMSCTLNIHSPPTPPSTLPVVSGIANNTNHTYSANISSYAEGAHEWYVNCSDGVNQGNSINRTFNKDTIVPIVTIDYPLDSQKFNTTSVHVNVSVTETNPNRLLIYKNATLASNTTAVDGVNSITLILPDNTYVLTAVATDIAGNSANDTITISIDTTVPVISNIIAANITNTSAIITAKTNEPSTCDVYYGTDINNLTQSDGMTIFALIYGTNHTVTLSSLSTGTMYYYKISCMDAYTNSQNSSIYSFSSASEVSAPANNTTTTTITVVTDVNGVNQTTAAFDILVNETVNAIITLATTDTNPTGTNMTVINVPVFATIESTTLNGTNIQTITIRLFYQDSDLPAGIDESSLRLYWFNGTGWEVMLPGGVDTTANYVWGTTTHLSIYSIGGSATAAPPSGGVGSNNGGLPGTSTPTETMKWFVMLPGQTASFVIANAKIFANELRFTSLTSALNVQLKITGLTAKPDTVTTPAGEVYGYLEITATNLAPENMKDTIIRFKVLKSWLGDKSGDMVLQRYKDGAWTEIPTTKLSDDGTYIYYEAKTPGFSTFAATFLFRESPPIVTPGEQPVTPPGEKPPVTTLPTVTQETNRLFVYALLGAVLVFVVIYAFTTKKRK